MEVLLGLYVRIYICTYGKKDSIMYPIYEALIKEQQA